MVLVIFLAYFGAEWRDYFPLACKVIVERKIVAKLLTTRSDLVSPGQDSWGGKPARSLIRQMLLGFEHHMQSSIKSHYILGQRQTLKTYK